MPEHGKFSVKRASKSMLNLIAMEYLSGPYVSLEGIAERYGIGERSVSNMLRRGIAEDIYSDHVADCIYGKIVYANPKGQFQRKILWEQAFDERAELRERRKAAKKEIERLQLRIAELDFQISSYDDYFIDEEGAPSKDELVSKRDSALEELERQEKLLK